MATGVANAETIRVRQRNGEIDALGCLPRFNVVQVVEPNSGLQDVGVSTSLYLWACPTKASLSKKRDNDSNTTD